MSRITLNGRRPDYVMIFSTIILVVFGLVMLASASSYAGQTKFGDSYYYLKHQIFYGLSFGIIGFIFAYNFYYQKYKKLALPGLLLIMFFLIMVFTPMGVRSGGAERWLNLGFITFQPSEFLKIVFLIYIAAWFSGKETRRTGFWGGLVPFLFISGIVSFLLFKQPTTSVIFILIPAAIAIYFVSGAKIIYVVGMIVVVPALIFSLIYLMHDYRWQRIQTFINPNTDIQQSGYHISQSLIAVGSGGWTGVGYGQSTTKISRLPEPMGDSIFAIIAEELGFIGVLIFMVPFMALVIRGFILARRTSDNFGKYLLTGFSALIGVQTFINIAAISGLIPMTGVPLPFISYGGTALAVFMTISGIMVNISRYSRG
ncbi:MAG: putative peptidoglycan glycosyltransferase FtsW [Candidatus Pacebacteria bacterium]|nr:putative peptidoglycan glycosyltransferase FtsW [Candidatus Paceibacterota bacterium]